MYYVGIDVGGMSVKCGFVDPTGKIVAKNRIVTDLSLGQEKLVDAISEMIAQTAKDAGLYDSIRQPNGTLNNCYVYGYVCGIVQEDLNIVIPLEVMSFDDKAYSILIDDVEYVLPEEWLIKFIAE